MKYKKKPVVIEAVEFLGDSSIGEKAPKWAYEAYKEGTIFRGENGWDFYIKTLEGDMLISIGDYIIQGVQGELYPCKPDIFDETYEQVGDGE